MTHTGNVTQKLAEISNGDSFNITQYISTDHLMKIFDLMDIVKSYNIKYPWVFIIAIVMIIVSIILIKINFVKFRTPEEKKSHHKSRKWIRRLMIITRTLIFISIAIALSTPFVIREDLVQGDPSIKILADNSTSFDLFDSSIIQELKPKLEEYVPTTVKYIANDNLSAIGNGILNNLQGNDNIIVVSDGNNNYGKELGDIITFASNMNSTINALRIEPIRDDTSVVIKGIDQAVRGTNTEFVAYVSQAGEEKDYHIKITLGNKVMIDEDAIGSRSFRFSRKMGVGYHKMSAEITINEEDDHFPDNNVYYKTIEILDRPKVFVYSKKLSFFYDFLAEIYHFSRESALASDLSEYNAIMLNDLSSDDMSNEDIEKITEFVTDGGGLIVIGGNTSYDRGNYKGSMIEHLLPVKSGETEREEAEKASVVIVMDISASTGASFGGGEDSKVDVEKALTLEILNDFKEHDEIGIIAFNTEAYVIRDLSRLKDIAMLEERISTLQDIGGTDITVGIEEATKMLALADGSRNIIVISDGVTQFPESAMAATERAKRAGITTYAVGVGQDTYEILLKNLASIGGGIYFRPSQAQRLKIIFGPPDENQEDDSMGLDILDNNHFITEGLMLDGSVTGYNVVAPKTSARTLVITSEGKSIMTVWRFGLGRVVALTTDDGTYWNGAMLSSANSELFTRTINWAIGDPTRNRDFSVNVKDTNLGESVEIKVRSKDQPVSDQVQFSKVDEELYSGMFRPEKTGFFNFFDAVAAVNYNKELEKVGLNPGLYDLVLISGGEIFNPEDVKNIVEKAIETSKRTEPIEVPFRWPFALFALCMLLLEIFIRRMWENFSK